MNQDLMILLLFEIISYFGLIVVQISWKKRGELTANRFALLNVSYLSVFIITAFLAISISYEHIIMFVGLVIIWWIGGIPFARWVYRQFFPDK